MKKGLLRLGTFLILGILSNSIWGQNYPALTPENETINITTTTTPSITFSETITYEPQNSIGTYYLKLYKYRNETWTKIDEYSITTFNGNLFDSSENLEINSTSITINPNENLDYNTKYYISTPSGLTNTDNFTGTDEATWSFTTLGPPNWITGYPNLSNQSPSNVTLNGQTDQDGTYHYVIVNNSEPAPSKEQIKQELKQDGTPAVVSGSGNMSASQAFSETIIISDLDKGSMYDLYIVAHNGSLFSENIVSKPIDLSAPDITSTMPTDNASGIKINSSVVLDLNEKIYATDGTEITPTNAAAYFSINDDSPITFSASFSNNDKTITLTPEKNLAGNTMCTISFPEKFEDQYGNEQATKTGDLTFTTEALNNWNGSAGSVWGNDSNWDGSYTSGNSVIIHAAASNFPVIDTGDDISVNNLYIEPGASITHNDGALSISGNLVLQSSVDGNASFLPKDGTLEIGDDQVFVEQEISNEQVSQVYFISSPIIGATKTSTGIPSSDILVSYDNHNHEYKYLDDSDVIEVGTGYQTKSSNDLTFQGNLQQTAITKTIHYTAYPPGGLGWNLIGNPFTSSINWNDVNLTDVENSFWIWLNNKGLYGTYNGNADVGTVEELENNGGIIPSNHSFWVKTTGESNGSVEIPTEAMATNEKSYLKSSSSSTKYPTLKLSSKFNNNKDELALALVPDATDSKDKYDTEKKIAGNENFIEVYTLIDENPMAINGMPQSKQSMEIPVGFNAETQGNCQFSLSLNTISESSTIMLHDKQTGAYTDLSSGASYSFDIEKTGRNNDRFSLIITESTVTSINPKEHSEQDNCYFYTRQSKIISYIGDLNHPEYKLFDTNGRLLKSGKLNAKSRNTIHVEEKGLVVFVVESMGKQAAKYKAVF